ncbi:MAG: GH1 family beta-glucosidase [bacterium]|nr:GH1 family beta-glucosidase [bacterium]
MHSKTKFPADFLWGVSTSAYQIEGGWNENGKGESNWDRWAHLGKIKNGNTGDITCDHYHLWKEDVRLMREIGINAYRFSIAWSRVLPDGKGKINQKSIDFYSNLVDELLKNNVKPFITLHHYDMPVTLEEEGGWVNRQTIGHFAKYAEIMAKHLGDRVKYWTTHNEPICIAGLGYSGTSEPPGLGDSKAGAQALHNLLVAHGSAVKSIKTERKGAKVGIVLNLYPVQPFNKESEDDRKVARTKDGILNRWFLDALYLGKYPEDVWAYQKENPEIKPNDMGTISTPTNFLGINYYSRYVVKGKREEGKLKIVDVSPEELGTPFSTMGWEIYPEGLGILLRRIGKDYKNPVILVTENGVALDDKIEPDGSINDPVRIDFLKRHIEELKNTISGGVDVRGYFVWTLMDTIEWELGFTQRFGLVYTDFKTLKRTVKASGRWYKNWINQT